MAWRLAGALVVLRNQINAMAPNRSRASDGAIGDQQHRVRCSRHNPNDFGVVTALDITHDPARGCDAHAIADHVRRHPHPQLAYVISRGRIAGRTTGWSWHRYTGANPHIVHAHFGAGTGSDCDPRPQYDSPQLWNITPHHAPVSASQEDDMPLNETDLANVRKIVVDELEKRDDSGPMRVVDEGYREGWPVYHTDFLTAINQVLPNTDGGALDQFVMGTKAISGENANALRVKPAVLDELWRAVHGIERDRSHLG